MSKGVRENKKKSEVKRVLITGVAGQDGIYMSAYLLFHEPDYDYQIVGVIRKNSKGIEYLRQVEDHLRKVQENGFLQKSSMKLFHGDVLDFICMKSLVERVGPLDYIYNFAA